MDRAASTPVHLAAYGLTAAGALNWGMVGLFKKDLVAALLGRGTLPARAFYTAVGAAGAYLALSMVQEARAARWMRDQERDSGIETHLERIQNAPALPVAP